MSTPVITTNEHNVFKNGLAFRSFFWLGTVFCILALSVWWLFWHGKIVMMPYAGMAWWHQHEMIFGFVAAIVVGFLLTAVQSWTGLPSLVGLRLWILVFVWGLARVLLVYPMALPASLVVLIDVLFLPMVALFMAFTVIKAKKWRNLIFAPVLLLLTFSNLGMHAGALTNRVELVNQSSYLAVWLIICLIVLVGGRVIPFFISRALNRPQIPAPKNREILVFISAATLCLLQTLRVFDVNIPAYVFVIPIVALIILNTWRLFSWEIQYCWRQPLLWGLNLSYGFIIVGSVLWVISEFNIVAVDLAIHALTIGAAMTIILAMMARVGLGHTGRTIRSLPGIGLGLIFILVAGLLRSVLLVFWPEATLWAYRTSLLLCIMAFSVFIVHYTIPLWTARPDGKAG